MEKNNFTLSILLIFFILLNNKMTVAEQKNAIFKNISSFPVYYYESLDSKINIIGFQGTHGTRNPGDIFIAPWEHLSKNFFLKGHNFFQFPNKNIAVPLLPIDRIKKDEILRIVNFNSYIKNKYPKKKTVYVAHHYGALSILELMSFNDNFEVDAIVFLSYPYFVHSFENKYYTLQKLKKLNDKEIPILLILNGNDKCEEIKINKLQNFLKDEILLNIKFEILNSNIKSQDHPCSHRGYHGFMGSEVELTNLIDDWLRSVL
jgi:hypothetical protein